MKAIYITGALLVCLAVPGARATAGPQEFLPSIDDTICIAEWQALGPFSVGYREGVQAAVPHPARLTPPAGAPGPRAVPREHRSILTQGGTARWRNVSPDSAGWVEIEFDNVFWDTIMDIYGYAGLVNKTFAYAEVHANQECRALIAAERVGTFYLNAVEHHGGLYGHDFVRVPVVLNKGSNPVVLSLTGFAGHRFRFEVLPSPAPVMLLNDYTTPDLVRDETGRLYTAVTLLNTTRSRIDGALLTIGDGVVVKVRRERIDNLAPLCMKKVPVSIDVISAPEGAEEVRIPVAVDYGGISFADSMRLRVRGPGQSIKRTFISRMDKSCQYYAVLPPEDFRPDEEYALILSLHGAGVRAEGQADAYKPKPWAFVIAPTNRRPFGFDWQDWGRLDALEVLDIAKRTLPIDTTRVYLTGHSMGGHGVWHVGLNHPDLFAAMAPEAGWTSFELYIPWFLQKSYILGDPRAVGMRDLALREDKPLNFVENAKNLGVFIVHGALDDNVPTMHGRMFAERLEELGYKYGYWEVSGRGHWWHDDSLDVSCVDYPVVMDFLRSHERRVDPPVVRFKTVNLATANRAYWVRINAQDEPMHATEVQAALLSGPGVALETPRIIVNTGNVEEFSLSPPAAPLQGRPVNLTIDGEERTFRFKDGEEVTFAKRAGKFLPGSLERGPLAKSPRLYGPIKQAYFSPFVLVYGTRGSTETTDALLHGARSQACRWWRRGNGYVDIVADTLVTDQIIEDFNLILFGGPAENSLTARIARDLPIRIVPGPNGGGIEVGSSLIEGRGLAAKFIYPNPVSPGRFVVVNMGTDAAGLDLSGFFKTIYAGAGLPDYIVYDERVRTRGWAGVLCTGFFDTDWEVDRGLMYLE